VNFPEHSGKQDTIHHSPPFSPVDVPVINKIVDDIVKSVKSQVQVFIIPGYFSVDTADLFRVQARISDLIPECAFMKAN